MPVVNQFPTKQYDVTNLIAKACSCCILTEELTLEPEEVVFRRGTLCDTYSAASHMASSAPSTRTRRAAAAPRRC